MPLADVNGVSLHYEITQGPPGAPVVLFSNSLGTTLEVWDAQVAALAAHGLRVLRYDTRGHGRSSRGATPPDIPTLAGDAAGLLDALAIPSAHVVGLSLGGLTGQQLGISHPDRVQSLVLMDTAAHLPPPSTWDDRIATVRSHGLAGLVDAVMGRWFTPAFGQADPAALALQRERFLAGNAAGYVDACVALRNADLRPGLARITAPTLVITGSEDPVTTPDMGRALAAAIPGGRFELIERGAHIIPVERAGEVNALLRDWFAAQGAAGLTA
jgi:3-oxoadipate enol-lactonase